MTAQASIDVDSRLQEAADLVEEIMSRRRRRTQDFLADLCDDCEAIAVIINTLDNLFIDLARGFKERRITGDSTLLEEHIRQTEIYLTARHLSPHLEQLTGAVSDAASDPRLKAEEYRAVAETLPVLASSLEEYQEELGTEAWTGVGQTEDWNLETLCERAREDDRGGGQVGRPLYEMAEQVSRNRDFTLSRKIHKLLGQAKQQTSQVAFLAKTLLHDDSGLAVDDEAYNLAAVRRLLLAAFDAKDLQRFLYYQPRLRPIIDSFGPGHGLSDMVDQVIKYCERHRLLEELLDEVKSDNPAAYDRWAPHLHVVVTDD